MRHRLQRLSITVAAMLCLPAAAHAFWWPWKVMEDAFGGGYAYPPPDPYAYAHPNGLAIASPPLPAVPLVPAAQPTTAATQPSPMMPAPMDNQVSTAADEPINDPAAPAAGQTEADSQHPPLPASGEVTLNVVSGGWVLANDRGLTLYTFSQDSPNQSNCTGTCAGKWPPVVAREDAVAIDNFSLVERGDGTRQWAYHGKPLYWWTGDRKPGDMTGDRMGGVWSAARL